MGLSRSWTILGIIFFCNAITRQPGFYSPMSTLEEIKSAIAQISPDDLAAFRAWFAEFDASNWDRQLEEDVTAGRLDALADAALQHLQAGRCTDL